MKYKFIAIEGNIGVGKTTLATMLAQHFKAKLILEEFADNPFLPKFYKDPKKFAFPLELSFLAERYQQLKDDISKQDLFNPLVISDYIFQKCLIFAKVNLPEAEFELFSKLFSIITPLLPKPDLLVYLYLEEEDLKINIAKRGRGYEEKIEKQYLTNIHNGYFDFFRSLADNRVLIIDITAADFVGNSKDFNAILNLLNLDYEKGIHRKILTEKKNYQKNPITESVK